MNELTLTMYKKDYVSKKDGSVKTATNFVLALGNEKILIKPAFDKDYKKLLMFGRVLERIIDK